MQTLIRLGSDFNLKSAKVKANFLKVLLRNIGGVLDQAGLSYKLDHSWSRVYVQTEIDVSHLLARVFGIGSVSPVDVSCAPNLDDMKALAIQTYGELVKGKSFCVRVKRQGVKEFTSTEAERAVGYELGALAREVDLTNPEIKIEIDVTAEEARFFSRRVAGPGGLPLGVQGRALCLFSGGFDSPVAAWRLMKRGVALDFVFCNLAGDDYRQSVLAVLKVLCDKWCVGVSSYVHILDFGPVKDAIDAKVSKSYAQVVLKRMFYKAGEKLNAEKNTLGLVTGEAIGQVSSQTLSNLYAINEASNCLILRPLQSFDKEEILDIARQIGTFTLSEHIKEYCALNKQKPITNAWASDIDYQESKIPVDQLIEDAIHNRESLEIRKIDPNLESSQSHYSDKIATNAVVIDSRDRASYEAWHYPDALHITLETHVKPAPSMDKTQDYLLLCEFGMQTALLSQTLRKKGIKAFSYRGGTRRLYKDMLANQR